MSAEEQMYFDKAPNAHVRAFRERERLAAIRDRSLAELRRTAHIREARRYA